jgi:hypothetical protein
MDDSIVESEETENMSERLMQTLMNADVDTEMVEMARVRVVG